MQPTLNAIPQESTNSTLLLIGPSGAGKSLAARNALLEVIREGGSGLVFDIGTDYLPVCQAVQGTYCKLLPNGTAEILRFGNTQLLVYDFSAVEQVKGSLPCAAVIQGIPSAVVVDEGHNVSRRYPVMPVVLRCYANLGSDVLLTGQRKEDLYRYLPLQGITERTLQLSRGTR